MQDLAIKKDLFLQEYCKILQELDLSPARFYLVIKKDLFLQDGSILMNKKIKRGIGITEKSH